MNSTRLQDDPLSRAAPDDDQDEVESGRPPSAAKAAGGSADEPPLAGFLGLATFIGFCLLEYHSARRTGPGRSGCARGSRGRAQRGTRGPLPYAAGAAPRVELARPQLLHCHAREGDGRARRASPCAEEVVLSLCVSLRLHRPLSAPSTLQYPSVSLSE